MSVKWSSIKKDVPSATIVFSIIEATVFYARSSRIFALPMPLATGQWWRALTCVFAHADSNHLASNVVAQLFILPMLEWDAGTGAAVLIYLMSGFCGSLAQAISYTGQPTILLGASGAVFGIIGGHLSTILLNWGDGIENAEIFFLVVSFYIVNEIATALTTESNVARHAHLIGALVGALVGLAVTVNVRKRPGEQYCRWFGAIGACVSLKVLSVLYSVYG